MYVSMWCALLLYCLNQILCCKQTSIKLCITQFHETLHSSSELHWCKQINGDDFNKNLWVTYTHKTSILTLATFISCCLSSTRRTKNPQIQSVRPSTIFMTDIWVACSSPFPHVETNFLHTFHKLNGSFYVDAASLCYMAVTSNCVCVWVAHV
jgi:hypothetical protein